METMMSDGAVRWRARCKLLLAQNCAQATLLTLEDAFGTRVPGLVKAATNLEGGVVGCGSSCGVVTGGVLGIGALRWFGRENGAAFSEQAVFELCREYVQWFRNRFGTTLCGERTGLDFARPTGMLRYVLPGTKLVGCLQHIGEAVAYLCHRLREPDAQGTSACGGAPAAGVLPADPHCACTVFRRLRDEADGRVPWMLGSATGLAGGAGGDGAACGALLGAFLSLGLAWGLDVRAMNLAGITRAFLVGHYHLVRHGRFARRSPGEVPDEPFARGRYLADRFVDRFGSLHCAEITGRGFGSVGEVRAFLDSGGCSETLSWCVGEARTLAAC